MPRGKKIMLTGHPALVVTALDMLEFTKDAVAFLSKVSTDAQVLILHGIQERLADANLVVRPPMFFPLTLKEQSAAASEQASALQQGSGKMKGAKPRSGDPLKRSKAMKLAWKKRRAAAAAAEQEKAEKKKVKAKTKPAKEAKAKVAKEKKVAASKAGAKKSKSKSPAKSKSKSAPATTAVPASDDAAVPETPASALEPLAPLGFGDGQ